MVLYDKDMLLSSAVMLLKNKFRSKIVKYEDLEDLVWLINLRKEKEKYFFDWVNSLWEYQFYDLNLKERLWIIWCIKKISNKKFDIIFEISLSNEEKKFIAMYLIWISLFSKFENWVESIDENYLDNFRYRIPCWIYKELDDNKISNTKEELSFQLALDVSINNDLLKKWYILKSWNLKELSQIFWLQEEIILHKLYQTKLLWENE